MKTPTPSPHLRPLRSPGRVLRGFVALVLVTVVVAVSAPGATAAPPPFEPDANSIGHLTFFDAAGNVVTSGNVNDAPFATYVQSSATIRAGDTKATLFGYLPKNGQTTGQFAGESLSLSTAYPNATAPAPLSSSALPLVKLGSGDATLGTLVEDFPNTAVDAYQGLYQLRVKTSASGLPATSTYASTDILISGTTWTQVYPTPPTTTTTALGVTPASPATAGDTVTLTATVVPSAALGSVQFYDGANAIGSPVAVASGTAQSTTTSLSVGPHTLTAKFTPTDVSAFLSSTSSGTSYTVNSAPATTTSTGLGVSPAGPVTFGDTVTLTATLTPSSAVGSVQFFDGASAIGSPVAVSAGSAQKTTTTLSVGSHSLTAQFTPTNAANFTSSTSSGSSLTVNPPPPTSTSTGLSVSPPSPVVFGASVTLTATLTPSSAVGSVQFFDGASAIGSPVAVAAGSAQTVTSNLTVGGHTLTAQFTPTNAANFTSSTSSGSSITVNSPPPDAVATATGLGVSPASPVTFGDTVTLTATVTPSNAVGAVQFYDGASAIGSPVAVASGSAQKTTTTLAVGSHTLTASFVPTNVADFTGSTSSGSSLTVNAPPPTTTSTGLGVSPGGPVTFGATVTLTATLTPSNAVGTVQFFDGASAIGSPVAVSAGSAQKTTSTLSVGSHSLTAQFTPTNAANFTTSTSSASSLTVNAPPPTTTSIDLGLSPAGPVVLGTSVTLTATLTPSNAVGTVQFFDGASAIGSPVAVSSGSAHVSVSSLTIGGHSLTAQFTPTNAANFTTSTSTAKSLTVNPPPTTTSVSLVLSPESPVTVGDEVTLTATLTPSGAVGSVQFYDGSTALGSAVVVSGGVAELTTSSLTVGDHTITAQFTPTDASAYAPSTSNGVSVTVDPEIIVTDGDGNPCPDGSTLTPGEDLTLTGHGFTPGEEVTATIASTPQTLRTAEADQNGDVTLEVTLPADLEPGDHTITLTGASVTRTYSLVVAEQVTTTTADPSTSTTDGGQTGDTFTTGGDLPSTGADTLPWVGLGLGLVVVGGLALVVSRRRMAA